MNNLFLRITSWNVRTMRTGLCDDLQEIDNARKTAVTEHELNRLDTGLAGLQETRFLDSGFLKEDHHTLFWTGFENAGNAEFDSLS